MTRSFKDPAEAKAFGLALRARGIQCGVIAHPAVPAFRFIPHSAREASWDIIWDEPAEETGHARDAQGDEPWGTSVGSNGWMCD